MDNSWAKVVKVGDVVKVERRYYGGESRVSLENVLKVSDKQLVTDHYSGGKRYWKVARTVGKYWTRTKPAGSEVEESRSYPSRIIGIASAEEVQAWKNKKAAEKAAETRRENKEKAEQAKRQELNDLFPTTGMLSASWEASVSSGDEGTFSVNIWNMTEQEVRMLAVMLSKGRTAEVAKS